MSGAVVVLLLGYRRRQAVLVKVATPRNKMYPHLQSNGTILLMEIILWFGMCLLAQVANSVMGLAGFNPVASCTEMCPATERPVSCNLHVPSVSLVP